MRKAIQILIPLCGGSAEEELIERLGEDEDSDFPHDKLHSLVLDALHRLGDFLDETGYTKPYGSIFSGSKQVGVVDIDDNYNVIHKGDRKKSTRSTERSRS